MQAEEVAAKVMTEESAIEIKKNTEKVNEFLLKMQMLKLMKPSQAIS